MLLNLKELTSIEGVNYRTDCPFCGGKDTFSMIREGGKVRYNCFRASCNPKKSRGTKSFTRTIEEIKNSINKNSDSQIKEFIIPDYFEFGILNERCERTLRKYNSYEVAMKEPNKIGYDPREDRLIFFLNIDGRITGAVGKSLSYSPIKSKIYNNSRGVFSCGEGDTIILVEDCLSACSASRSSGSVGTSLNGTNLTKDHLPFLKKYDMVTIALDKDATRKSLKLAQQLNFIGIKTKIAYLENDLKDCKILPNFL